MIQKVRLLGHQSLQRYYVNKRDKVDSKFRVTETRPKKFYLITFKKVTGKDVIIPKKEKKWTYLEKDLHPFLTYFAFYYLNSYTKTLSHQKSKRKEFGEWVHPDVVGCSFVLNDFKKVIADFSRSIGNIQVKLISFEVKRELNFSNLREAFFQAVSNSSWANEGYLVASEISNDEEFTNELQRLSSSFGIGIIKLDVSDPDASVILYQSRQNDNLDWDTINKLTMNSDFKDFIQRVQKDIENNEIYKEKYDKILERDALPNLLN